MNEFTTTLTAFLAGRAEFSELDAALTRSLQADPSIGAAAFAEIDRIYRANRLPLQLYVVLKNRIAQSHAAAPRPQPAAPLAPVPPPPSEPVRPRPQAPAATAGPAPHGPAFPQAPPAPQRAAPPEAPAPEPASPDRTIFRARPAGRPAPDVSLPHTGPPADASAPQTGGFAAITGQTGAPVTGKTGTGTSGGTGASWAADAASSSGQPAAILERGAVLKERYVLESEIGRGGMGVVFKAKDLLYEEMQDRNPYVAIKILNEEFRRHPESLKALQREARKAQKLAHPNIVNVYGFDRDKGTGTVYMAMEFLEGESLDRVIKSGKFQGLSLDEAFPIIRGLGSALGYAHASDIVHSDFKPGNCFLTKGGGIKVFDFGIARAAKIKGVRHDSSDVTHFDPGTLGALTVAYASCEMFDGEEPDPRDDIYAFGCVVYELLTSKHPFEEAKKNAVEARDKKLVPARIKGLSTRQWRALLKSLAFGRADRSASVDEVVTGLAKQPFNFTRAAIGVAAALVLAVAGYFGFLQWQQQQTDALVAALQSGDDARVPAAVERMRALDEGERNDVLPLVEGPLIAWYVGRATAAVDESQGRYGFQDAKRLLAEVEALYVGRSVIRDERTGVEQREKELVAELNDRFNESLDAGRLLADDDSDDIPEILAIVRQIQADHGLLSDPRLAFAYGQQASAALARDDLTAAAQLLEGGLAHAPNDSQLLNLQESLASERRSQQSALRAAELSRTLQAASAVRTLPELRARERDALELAALAPEDATLRAYRTNLVAAVDTELRAAVTNRDWAAAQQLIDDSSTLLGELQRGPRDRLAAARQSYDRDRNALVERSGGAATAGRVGDARDALADLQELRADADTLQQARGNVVTSYVNLVQQRVGANALEAAKAELARGLEFAPDAERLIAIRDDIAGQERLAAERGREEAARQLSAEADALLRQIDSALAATPLSNAAAEQALRAIDQLRGRASTDPRVTAGRERIATKLASQALELGRDSGQWDQAVTAINSGLGLVAESTSLKAALESAQANLASARTNQQEQRVAQQRRVLKELLDTPRDDAAWEPEVRAAMTALSGLVPDGDPGLAQEQQRAAQRFVGRAGVMRAREQFDEADRLLALAATFGSQDSALIAERERVRNERSASAQANTAKAEELRIEGLKTTFLARANADDTRGAISTLREIEGSVPATDVFRTTTAPQAIVALYVRLVEPNLRDERFDDAEELVAAGLGLVNSPTLRDLRTRIGTARADAALRDFDTLMAQLARGAANANEGRALLDKIRDNDPAGSAAREANLIARAQQRVDTNPDDAAYRTYVSTLFRRDFRAPVSPPAPTPTTTTTTTTAGSGTPTGPAPARPAGPRACTTSLATLGARGACADALTSGGSGPALIVPGAVAGLEAFAIGRTEVTVQEWNVYCNASTSCTASTVVADFPVTGITAAAAEGYTRWLSEETGATYRLPTAQEWRHAAYSPGQGTQSPNCDRAGLLLGANSGGGNAWGLMGYKGNAQEWVTTEAGLRVTGGHFNTPLARCNDSLAQHDGSAEPFTGFRLVRELSGD